MMFFALVLMLRRIALAVQVIWTVARQRQIRGRLPWRFFRRLMVSDLPVIFRVIGLAGVLVVWPTAVLIPETWYSDLLLLLAMAMFAAGAAMPRALHSSPSTDEKILRLLKRMAGRV